ncbi:hypothetical protein [Phytobacter sp. V91]|uniref:hypothetical protein n=1 Tax=Phytobacter sp. V91 TaxID=3369425 RepID=UPI003F619095
MYRHPQYWLGQLIALAPMVLLTFLFNQFLPVDDYLLFGLIRTICPLLPPLFVAEQFRIVVMRKHYQHLLMHLPEACGAQDEEVQRLIQDADNKERHQWRYLYWFTRPASILVLLLMLSLLMKVVA